MKYNVLEANKVTKNGRVYPKEALNNIINDPIIKEKIESHSFFVKDEYDNIVGVCNDVSLSEDGTILQADISLSDTIVGIPKVSTEGVGCIEIETDTGLQRVKDDYQLKNLIVESNHKEFMIKEEIIMKNCNTCKYDHNSYIDDFGCWRCNQYSHWKSRFRGRCYLAGGWFSPAQKSALDRVEGFLQTYEDKKLISVFSPRRDNDFNKIKGPRTTQDRMKCFRDDIEAIDKCDFMICSAVEYDSGTMVELGYAYAKGIPIIYYNDNPEDHKRVRNLMLVGMCNNYYAKSLYDLEYILETGEQTTHGDDSESDLGRLGEDVK